MSSPPYLDESIKTRQCDLSCLSPSHSSKLECCALVFEVQTTRLGTHESFDMNAMLADAYMMHRTCLTEWLQ